MAAFGSEDSIFYARQQEGEYKWLLPVGAALLLHVLSLVATVYLPDLLPHKPLLDEVVTVSLVSMPESGGPAALASPPAQEVPPVKPTPPPEPEPEPEPEPDEPVVSLAQKEPVPVPEAKVVSLKPLKKKKKITEDTRLEEEKLQEQLTRIQQEAEKKKLAEEKKKAEEERRKLAEEQKKAEEERRKLAEEKRKEQERIQRQIAEARRAEQDAQAAARELERIRAENAAVSQARAGAAPGPAASQGSGSGRGSGGGQKQINSVVLGNYLSALQGHVQDNWKLPEMRTWPPNLETIVEFTVHRDGSISNLTIAKKSGDDMFDQFVLKTMNSSVPMPRFPNLLQDGSLDFGLRFKPSGVQKG